MKLRNTKKYREATKLLQEEAKKRNILSVSYKDKIIQFYNPVLHYGMSPENFVEELIKHFKKTDNKLSKWIYANKNSQYKYVSKIVSLNGVGRG